MKKIFLLIILFTVSISGFSQLLTEDFTYTAGQLLTANGWTAHSGAGTNAITVTSPGLTYSGHTGSGVGNAITMATSGEDDNKAFTAVTSGTVYMSFLINVSAVQTGDYCIGLYQSATIFPLRVYIKSDGASGYFFGVSKASGAITYETTSRSLNTTYFIVADYIYNTGTTTDDVVNLWVNPALGGTETTGTIPNVSGATATDATTIGAVYLRQGGAALSPTCQIDAILVGTTWASVTPGAAATPTLSASALTAFPATCINTTAGPNNFTLTGANLTTADITIGALAGYTYSTTAGGTYTSTLTITHAAGTLSQTVYVKFTPTAVQSYNGNIAVAGGGVASFNVAAVGSGINTPVTVTTGAASAITINSATVAGSYTAGCSAVSPYGIEYSLTSGFTPGTGTKVPSTNQVAGAFTSGLSGLAGGTTYYYRAYATDNTGTVYGTESSFVTATPAASLSATPLTAFGATCINTTVGPNSFDITGSNLTAADVTVGALAGFTYSTTSGGTYNPTLTITHAAGAFSQTVFVKFTPTAVQPYNGSISVGGGGAASITVAAAGSGVNTKPTVATGGSSAITTVSATLAGTISAIGCSAITSAYGIEWSLVNGFADGAGTQVTSTNLAGGAFSSNLAGLTPNTTYYYKAYATNAGGIAYGTQQQFTTLALTPTINTTTLTAFGNICLNTTAGPNSFTINGSALNTTNVTVAALAGFTYSTTAAGTYTTSLSLTQPGGTYSQAIYVKFTPTAVQSYNGNIVVSGGGAASSNVAASGAGVNTTATVTTGAASAITGISATLAGTIPTIGCSAVTAYGIEYSTTNGFPNGGGTAVASTNLSGANFSSAVSGLTPATVYYYHAYATNGGGTVYGAQQTFTTATPVLTATALTAFGNTCLNTTAGPNSFTINGTNLGTASVTVAALAGFTYSTTAAGTYTTTLTLTQIGGTYSQQIFVKFTPTAVQSYSGNIVVGGGNAANINVAASGAGVNTAATVTTGAASAITQISATTAGTIPTTGCTAVTAYGVEYSTTTGFPNGTGTAVASTNLSGTAFTAALTGLTPSATYYYHAYATNGGGTAYGAQQSFTTLAPVLTATTLTAFGSTCINTTVGPNSFTINSTAVTAANITVGPLAGYTFSTTSGGTYSASLSLTHAAGPYSQAIFVMFTPTAVQSYNGNIPVSGGGATVTINVAASGSGANTAAAVVTGTATVLSPIAATVNGSISNIGCSNVTAYGIEYTGISGLANGLGTKVPSSNLSGAAFSSTLTGLVQGATYYYKAYATNNGGTTYGSEQSFTTTAIPGGLVIYSNPIKVGGQLHFTLKDITPDHYYAQVFNEAGQIVYQYDMIIPTNFIDVSFTIPGKLTPGIYSLRVGNVNGYATNRAFLLVR